MPLGDLWRYDRATITRDGTRPRAWPCAACNRLTPKAYKVTAEATARHPEYVFTFPACNMDHAERAVIRGAEEGAKHVRNNAQPITEWGPDGVPELPDSSSPRTREQWREFYASFDVEKHWRKCSESDAFFRSRRDSQPGRKRRASRAHA